MLREQDCHVVVWRVGEVDAGVRAGQAVMRLADQNTGHGAEDPARLAQDELDLSRVLVHLGGELARARGGFYLAQSHQTALRLGDDLLGDHQYTRAWGNAFREGASRGRFRERSPGGLRSPEGACSSREALQDLARLTRDAGGEHAGRVLGSVQIDARQLVE